MPVGKVAHTPLSGDGTGAILKIQSTKHMRYEILVPSAMHESESVLDLDRAHDICYDLAQEHGYAEIRHNGVHIADYGSIMEQIADLLF